MKKIADEGGDGGGGFVVEEVASVFDDVEFGVEMMGEGDGGGLGDEAVGGTSDEKNLFVGISEVEILDAVTRREAGGFEEGAFGVMVGGGASVGGLEGGPKKGGRFFGDEEIFGGGVGDETAGGEEDEGLERDKEGVGILGDGGEEDEMVGEEVGVGGGEISGDDGAHGMADEDGFCDMMI